MAQNVEVVLDKKKTKKNKKKNRTCFSCVTNAVNDDVLATQGTGASAAMVMTYLTHLPRASYIRQ